MPNKATTEIRELARSIVKDDGYPQKLRARVEAGKAPHMETLLFHYAFGKPKDWVDLGEEDSRLASLRVVFVHPKESK